MVHREAGSPAPRRGLSIANLAQMLFKGDASPEYIRSLPAQSLYLAVKHLGLASSADILESATLEQCRLLFDFDCWNKDEFNEDAFWEWLSIADDEHGLRLLQKFVKFVDLKLVGLMISRYVETKVFEEKTDNPPAPGFFTPDQGSTWVHVTVEEGTRNFLLSRLLALLFETSTEVFYQILSIPSVATQSELQEESYQERTKRLQAEGLPSDEYAHELNSPLSDQELSALLASGRTAPGDLKDLPVIEPMIYDGIMIRPFADLLRELKNREEFEGELTLITNAAFLCWNVDISDEERVRHWIAKVRGAINIGIEVAVEKSKGSPAQACAGIGLKALYRIGLTRLMALRRIALRIDDDRLRSLSSESELLGIIAGAREAFPEAPLFLSAQGKILSEGGNLQPGHRSFDHVVEIESVIQALSGVDCKK